MATRGTVTHSGGATAPLQPNGVYIGTITAVTAEFAAKVRIAALGITVGPCRAIDGLVLEKGKQVLCMFLNGRLSEMVIVGSFSSSGTGSSYQSVVTITDTSYIPSVSDQPKLLNFVNASPVLVTLPLYSNQPFEIGSVVDITQGGTGQITIQGDTGVTVRTTALAKTRTQYSVVSIIKIDTNEWVLVGDLAVV